MYIVTFYSFKGGVGRTMALANVGLALARAGRRVLLVDFDLEAPGLDTFDKLRPSEPTPGVVDFVTEYHKTGMAPDLREFVYRPPDLGFDGTVWVMPTGKQDAEYGDRLNAIDWQQLYAEQNGFLLFEDLKAQWSRTLQPDYVLIDSRTGHTDIGGICTRQLPDAVVLLFFPNEQNLRGLETVAREIRRESRESGRSIRLWFVPANVPKLDDEDKILQDRLRDFRQALDCQRFAAKIHHYDSLSLLQQTVFTIDRPRTELAREYEALAKRVISRNLGDRAVVMEFLDGVSSGLARSRSYTPEEVDELLREIRGSYTQDGAVLFALGQANRSLGREDAAEQLVAEAERCGYISEEKLIEQATQNYASNRVNEARQRIREVLGRPRKHLFALERVFSIVLASDIHFLGELVTALGSVPVEPGEVLYISQRLMVRRDALPTVERLLLPLISGDEEDPLRDHARGALSLCLIGQRRFAEARALLAPHGGGVSPMEIQDCFNYGMAEWGETGVVPTDVFSRVLAKDAAAPRGAAGANYLQCLSIANWAVGQNGTARECAARARSAAAEKEFGFSAWRYLYVGKGEFLRDLDSVDTMIDSGRGKPLIVCDHD